jgi:hypothetical protein
MVKFAGLTAVSQLSDISISIGELSIDKKKLIENITETAIAVDQYQYNICNILSNPTLTKNLSPGRLEQHTENLIGAHACIVQYRLAFEAFKQDPEGQRDNLNMSFIKVQNFFQSVVDQSAPKTNAEERRRKAISEVLSSIGIEGKDQDRTQLFAIVSKPRNYVWKRENLEDQIRNETTSLHARLMQIITHKNLNSQLSCSVGASGDSSRIDGSSIFEMVDLLIRNGVLTDVNERAMGFMEELRRICDSVANGEQTSLEELDKSDYGLAVPWLQSRLDDIEEGERQQQM